MGQMMLLWMYLVTNKSGSDFYIMKTVDVPADSSLVIEKPINLEANDILKVKASAALIYKHLPVF